MNKTQVMEALMSKTVAADIVFKKTNGEIREMKCSRSSYHIPPANAPKNDPDKPKKKPNPDVCSVFDVDNCVWKSFRWDKLVSVNGMDYVEEVDANE